MGSMLEGVESQVGHYRRRDRGPAPSPRSPALRRLQGRVSKLMARYRAEGDAAFEPRHDGPTPAPTRPARGVELVLRLRKHLTEEGLDAGADTIGWHLTHHHQLTVVEGHDQPDPGPRRRSRPRARERPSRPTSASRPSMPNETWQSDFTHYRLTRPGDPEPPQTRLEIITWLDDHSRYALHVTAHHAVTGPIVVATFRETAAQHGFPASMLTDNGMVYTTASPAAAAAATSLETTSPPRHRTEELPAEPPHHLRQGRTLPADHEEVAPRPTPNRHDRRAAEP